MNHYEQARKKLLRGNGEMRVLRKKMKTAGKSTDHHERTYIEICSHSREICFRIQHLRNDASMFSEVVMDEFKYGGKWLMGRPPV